MTSVAPTPAEVSASLPGDDLVDADVVMDRAFDLPAAPDVVWPWLVQLGKRRAGWYLSRSVERLVPRGRRALRHLDPALLRHQVGDVIPDWGGAEATFTVAAIEPERTLLYTSTRGRSELTWCLSLSSYAAAAGRSRLHLRLRIGPVKHRRLAEVGGGFFDWLTIKGLASGLAERVR